MRIVDTFAAVRGAREGTVGLVPTMGAFHEGHLSHIESSAGADDTVVVSLFVNPLQFDEGGDLDRYPRDIERDGALAEAAGVDVLFAPPLVEMYPEPPATRVVVSGVSEGMEGAYRPGHFEGVATVVAKLLAGIGPSHAVLGRKDAQQLAVVRRMVSDLSFPVEIVAGSTVRDPDGLALSSRNVFLTGSERSTALSLSRGLSDAAEVLSSGERSADALEAVVSGTVRQSDAELEYVELADAFTAELLDEVDRESFLAVAARVGETRLIDNVVMWPDGSSDTGTRLTEPSKLGKE